MTNFEGVSTPLQTALTQQGYETLTPVQQAVLQLDQPDVDILVSAQTGSGKTVAFGIALARTLLAGRDAFERSEAPLALIVAPTRELAMQVQRELTWLFAPTDAFVASCVGGMDYRAERRVLERGAHIVVGTPGRLRDHIQRRSLDLRSLKAVVLDEADEMLDLGFKEDLEFILSTAPLERRTMMFSATLPASIEKLAQTYQTDAVRIKTIDEHTQHLDIDYQAITVAKQDRENAIINILRFHDAENALVFCNTRIAVNRMVSRLNNRGFSVVALSGEFSQNERTHALQAMRDGRARICVATDVAARGIDLPNLDLVIHAELPTNPETLLHRSGRTGRAGRKGISALIVDAKWNRNAQRLLRHAEITASWVNAPSAEDVNRRDHDRILASPFLLENLQEIERPLVLDLMDTHNPEQIAVAFLRLSQSELSAPEELTEIEFSLERLGGEPSRKGRKRPGKHRKFSKSRSDEQNSDQPRSKKKPFDKKRKPKIKGEPWKKSASKEGKAASRPRDGSPPKQKAGKKGPAHRPGGKKKRTPAS